MNKLRLLLHTTCNRTCEGCCNKDWPIGDIPFATDFSGYQIVMLTGGEPMLDPGKVVKVSTEIRLQNPTAKVYVYTADVRDQYAAMYVLSKVDGLTVTLHEQADVEPFSEFAQTLFNHIDLAKKSLRLNVFKGITFNPLHAIDWDIKRDMEWIKDCPLPAGEVFMRYLNETSNMVL